MGLLDNMFDLTGKVAVITGAGSGIGEATCLVLAEAGAAIVAADINEAGAKATADQVVEQGGKAVAITVLTPRFRSVTSSEVPANGERPWNRVDTRSLGC